MRRRATVLLVVGLALALLPACGKRVTEDERLRNALNETRRLAARVEYEETRPDSGTVLVQGLVEDDFRFKSRVFYDGAPGYDEVVADDVLAMRVLDANVLADLVNPEVAGTVDQSTEIKGVSVIAALKSRRWVKDPKGAPIVSGLGQTEATLGKDPALDAVTAIDYTLGALKTSGGARRWSEDSLSPTYPGPEDPFDKPGDGEIRYDLSRPRLPSPAEARTGAGGQVAVPGTKHFRKMAIYLRDGKVVRVEERIELTGRSLRDFVKWFDLYLREIKAEAARNDLKRIVDETPEPRLGAALLKMLSNGLVSFGEQPILVRSMSLRLEDLGAKVEITLPDEQVLTGNLSALVTSGAAKVPKATGGSAPPEDGGGGEGGGEAPSTEGGGTGDTTTTSAPSA